MKVLPSGLLIAAAILFTFGEAGRTLKIKNRQPNEDTRSIVIDINGEIFYLDLGEYTWNEAKVHCKSMGMQMVTLATQERWEMIREWFLANQEYNSWTWSSGQKPAEQEEFMWMTTGENFTYTAWNPDEPSITPISETCMDFIGVNLGAGLGWDDDTCDFKLHVMCEAFSV